MRMLVQPDPATVSERLLADSIAVSDQMLFSKGQFSSDSFTGTYAKRSHSYRIGQVSLILRSVV